MNRNLNRLIGLMQVVRDLMNFSSSDLESC